MIFDVVISIAANETVICFNAQMLKDIVLFFPLTASHSGGLSAVQIKMEGQESGETITDIQNYLETFNKEIQGGDQMVQHMTGDNIFFGCN